MKLLKTAGIISLLLMMSLSASGLKAQDTGIKFFKGTFAEAQAKALKEDKLIFMDAYAVWCGPCKWMAANTFTDAEVATYFNNNFINLKMDMEKGEGPALARKYGVRAYPTLYFLKPDGSVAKSVMGAQRPDGLLSIGKKVVDTASR
jgi:thiol:disulfide interchange protein